MILEWLKQRSSWPSSFITGLIGWNGFFILTALALGYTTPTSTLFITATLAAFTQVVILRLGFNLFRLDRGPLGGAIAGGLTGAGLLLIEILIFPALSEHAVIWLLNAIYIGAAVGLFLSYFHRDDRRIEAEASANNQPVDYGRDAHWLEPFVFGAVAYVVAFVPRSFDLIVAALVVGAMSGVVAAGVSHFFLFAGSRRSSLWPMLLSLIAGASQGAATGLLFRHYAEQLFFSFIVHGIIAGVLTYLMTALRGQALAQEEKAEARPSGRASL
jgi:hypothetical protein